MEGFPKEIHDHLQYYVYRLIDPRDGSTFYVGKGQKNRVFDHVKGAIQFNNDPEDDSQEDMASAKMKMIMEIKTAGLEPIHVIHRHGMTEETAIEVEAALIDATPGLTNEMPGHTSNEYGPAHVNQIIQRYAAEEIQFNPNHKIMVIKLRTSTVETYGLYNAVRYAWKVNISKAAQVDYVLAVTDGICKGMFIPESWFQLTRKDEAREEFPTRQDIDLRSGRYSFRGKEANQEISDMYKGKRLPGHLRKKGMASPILYVS